MGGFKVVQKWWEGYLLFLSFAFGNFFVYLGGMKGGICKESSEWAFT